jgi:hypothetical protein
LAIIGDLYAYDPNIEKVLLELGPSAAATLIASTINVAVIYAINVVIVNKVKLNTGPNITKP